MNLSPKVFLLESFIVGKFYCFIASLLTSVVSSFSEHSFAPLSSPRLQFNTKIGHLQNWSEHLTGNNVQEIGVIGILDN